MKAIILLSVILFNGISFVSCSSVKPDQKAAEERAPEIISIKDVSLSAEEQQKKSLEVFNQILEVSQEGDREYQISKMTELYLEIINDFPDAPLAQESYLRLIGLYLRDYKPAQKDEAMQLYEYYVQRYPESPLINAIEETISRFFYDNKEWEELKAFMMPHIKEFIGTGELKTSIHMFYFSEAHFNMKNYREAYKGYRIVVKKFPKSRNAKIAQARIDVIKKKVEENNRKGD